MMQSGFLKNGVRGVISFCLSGAVLLGAAAAGEEEYAFADIRRIEVIDFIGTVEIAAGEGALRAVLVDPEKEDATAYDVDVTGKGGAFVARGPYRPNVNKISRKIQWRRFDEDAFEEFLKDYPTLRIVAPSGVAVKIYHSVVEASGGDLRGDLVIGRGMVEAAFGDMRSADIDIHSRGDIYVGEIAEELDIGVHGSGDFEAVSAARAKIAVNGSGDIAIGDVAGDADVAIMGSGDVKTAGVGGALVTTIQGSGDVQGGEVKGGAQLAIKGSGDISLISVNGPTSASIMGGGDISIASGLAEDLKVSITGSGDFAFGGKATNLDASIAGSGDVSVASNDGALKIAGNGSVRVGGVEKNRKRDR